MEIHPVFIFLIIFLSVPAQYFFSPSNAGHIKYHFKSLLSSISPYLPDFGGAENEEVDIGKKDESALDDFEDIDQYGFGHYERIRSPNVKFRVGDIIYHKVLGYRGVVIGWDEVANAPEEFIERVHKGKKEWTNNPNYAVAIDHRDRENPQIGYVVQENLEPSSGRIIHIVLGKFFERYDETKNRYIMRPHTKKWYPDD